MIKQSFIKIWILFLSLGLFISSMCLVMSFAYANDMEIVSINIDLQIGDYDLNNMPNAIQNETYPIFDYSATDNLGNEVEDVSVLVYYDQDGNTNIGSSLDDKLVAVKDGRFLTDKEGIYIIEYVASKGRISERARIYVKALSADDYVAPRYVPNENIPSSIKAGEKVFLLEGALFQDARYGITEVSTEITYEGLYSPQEIQIYENKKENDFFIPKACGKYTIQYKLKNILGQNKIVCFEKVIDVENSENPKIDEHVFDKVYFKGETINFPTTQAREFVDGEVYYVPIKVFINDEEITSSMKYTFSNLGVYKIKYQAQSVLTENDSVIEQEVVVSDIAVNDEEMFISKYLYLDGFEEKYFKDDSSEYENNVLTLTTPNGKRDISVMEFKRPIIKEMLNVSVGVETTKCNFEQLYVRFTDSENSSEFIEMSFIEKIEKGVRSVEKYLNGKFVGVYSGKVFSGAGAVYSPTTFSLEYNKSDFTIIDKDGQKVFELNSYFGGEIFKGFSSGKAYIQVGIKNITAESQIKIYSIAGTAISNSEKDKVKPTFLVTEDNPQYIRGEYGTQIVIPKIKVFDLYDDNVRIDIKIAKKSGAVLVQHTMDGDYLFQGDAYGELVITYTATDFSGNKRDKRCILIVIDRISPTVNIPSVPASFGLGATLTIPKVDYIDNSGSECTTSAYIIDTAGNRKWIKDGIYIFNAVGEYKLRIFVFDSDGNSTCIEYVIHCK